MHACAFPHTKLHFFLGYLEYLLYMHFIFVWRCIIIYGLLLSKDLSMKNLFVHS